MNCRKKAPNPLLRLGALLDLNYILVNQRRQIVF